MLNAAMNYEVGQYIKKVVTNPHIPAKQKLMIGKNTTVKTSVDMKSMAKKGLLIPGYEYRYKMGNCFAAMKKTATTNNVSWRAWIGQNFNGMSRVTIYKYIFLSNFYNLDKYSFLGTSWLYDLLRHPSAIKHTFDAEVILKDLFRKWGVTIHPHSATRDSVRAAKIQLQQEWVYRKAAKQNNEEPVSWNIYNIKIFPALLRHDPNKPLTTKMVQEKMMELEGVKMHLNSISTTFKRRLVRRGYMQEIPGTSQLKKYKFTKKLRAVTANYNHMHKENPDSGNYDIKEALQTLISKRNEMQLEIEQIDNAIDLLRQGKKVIQNMKKSEE